MTCTVTAPPTQSTGLPTTINQCNASGRTGASTVTCTATITNNFTDSTTGGSTSTPTPTTPTATPVSSGGGSKGGGKSKKKKPTSKGGKGGGGKTTDKGGTGKGGKTTDKGDTGKGGNATNGGGGDDSGTGGGSTSDSGGGSTSSARRGRRRYDRIRSPGRCGTPEYRPRHAHPVDGGRPADPARSGPQDQGSEAGLDPGLVTLSHRCGLLRLFGDERRKRIMRDAAPDDARQGEVMGVGRRLSAGGARLRGAGGASASHPGTLPAEVTGLSEQELLELETKTLGPEHAAEHAEMRELQREEGEIGSAITRRGRGRGAGPTGRRALRTRWASGMRRSRSRSSASTP